MHLWHWCVTWDPEPRNWVSAFRIVQTFNSSVEMKRRELKNTEMWHMWFMGHIMAVSGFPSREGRAGSVRSLVGKSPWVTAAQCSAISLSVHNFSTLFLFISFFLTAYVLPQSLLSPSSLLVYCSLPFILFVFLSVSSLHPPWSLSTVFHWAVRERCSECGYMGGFATAVTVIFLFLFCALEV